MRSRKKVDWAIDILGLAGISLQKTEEFIRGGQRQSGTWGAIVKRPESLSDG